VFSDGKGKSRRVAALINQGSRFFAAATHFNFAPVTHQRVHFPEFSLRVCEPRPPGHRRIRRSTPVWIRSAKNVFCALKLKMYNVRAKYVVDTTDPTDRDKTASESGAGAPDVQALNPTEVLPPDRIERLARVLFEKMEHLDPSEQGDVGWEALSPFEREFYQVCVAAILLELG
jgi:hypothetical protein